MYKVFFNDRTVFFEDNICDNLRSKSGLFYKFHNVRELKLILSIFEKIEEIPRLHLCAKDTDELKMEFVTCFKYLEAAGGLVKNRNNEYLFIYRLGKWDLPKGKAEKGESINETAIRETEEECGIHGMRIIRELPSTYHTYHRNKKWILKRTYWFEMEYDGNEDLVPQTKEDIQIARWFKPNGFLEITANTYPAILEVMKDGGILNT